jgi:hypothetical protein
MTIRDFLVRVTGLRRFRSACRQHLIWRTYKKEFAAYSQQARCHGLSPPKWEERYPCLDDRSIAMAYEPHYTYHCAWACRILAENPPSEHIDISSSLMFAAMASAWVPVHYIDFRVPRIVLPGLRTSCGDLTKLPFSSNSIESLSCMHVIEHVGLGRYGDPLDPSGDRLAAQELTRVLAPTGQLLVVVPVGRPRINFNAHRVYSYEEVTALFPSLMLKTFELIPDQYQDGMINRPQPDYVNSQEWGCGCFIFRKS